MQLNILNITHFSISRSQPPSKRQGRRLRDLLALVDVLVGHVVLLGVDDDAGVARALRQLVLEVVVVVGDLLVRRHGRRRLTAVEAAEGLGLVHGVAVGVGQRLQVEALLEKMEDVRVSNFLVLEKSLDT